LPPENCVTEKLLKSRINPKQFPSENSKRKLNSKKKKSRPVRLYLTQTALSGVKKTLSSIEIIAKAPGAINII